MSLRCFSLQLWRCLLGNDASASSVCRVSGKAVDESAKPEAHRMNSTEISCFGCLDACSTS